jgi:hypothetical protein
MISITPTDFKAFFIRDFQYAPVIDPDEDPPAPSPDPALITDNDIDKAIDEAECVFNHDLYPNTDIEKKCLLYLTAHFLKTDYDAAESGAGTMLLQNSRSVGSVSESVNIPDWMNNGEFSFYAVTYYGQKFIILSKPYLDGAVFCVAGATQP